MDRFLAFYMKREGRILRKHWWLGMLGLHLVAGIIGMIWLFGTFPDMRALQESGADLATTSAAWNEGARRSAWFSLFMFLVVAYPPYCLSTKRRHDRDSSGLDVLIYMALTTLVLLIQALGVGSTPTDIGDGFITFVPSIWLSALSLILGVLGVYLFVVLGFLRGTNGKNSFGADPVLGRAASA